MLLKPRRLLRQGRLLSAFLLFLLVFFVNTLHAQTGQITGRIVDRTTNLGVPRVSVTVRGTSRGTVTDENGYYKIDAAQGDVLVFSSQGYAGQEVAVSGTTADISFVPDTKQLSEVVVVGYGQKSRRLLTESIGTVSSKEIQRLPVASADAAIQGRVSGVQITNSDGAPGSPAAIRIRGVGTVGNAQPLFVIDGIPVGNGGGNNTNPLATINPADIENISVLKDASSAAVYGMRAANGVVLITTKRGKSGKPRINFDAYYGIQRFPKRLDVNNTQQFVELAQEAITNRNLQENRNDLIHVDLRPGTPRSVLGVNTDWQSVVINNNAPVANYNVGVTGGNENASYFFSMGYFNQEAITRNWDLSRYTMRANSDYKIGGRFKIGQTLALSFQEVNRGINGGGDGFLYANAVGFPPFFKFRDDENTIPNNRYGFNGNLDVAGVTRGNQSALNELVETQEHTYRLLGGLYAELEVLKDLKLRSAASIDLDFNRGTRWQPGFTAAEIGYGRESNNFSDNRGQGYTQVFTNTLGYDKAFGEHNISAVGGIEYQKLRGNSLGYTGVNFSSVNPDFQFFRSAANGAGTNGQFANASSGLFNEGYARYFGRVSYNYQDKYLLTGTVSSDGTSKFASGYRWGVFPAVSAAWRISEEKFFEGVPVISDLKLRGSWGRLGNANTSSFGYVSTLTFNPQYPIGNVPTQAPAFAGFINRELGWETVQSLDFGFDASLFNNKVNLLATYYKRNTLDFLYSLPVPYTSGFSNRPVNLGEVENKGFEFELGYNTSLFKKVNLNLSANLTTVKNELVALAPSVQEFSSGDYRTAVGYPIGYFYGYKMLGIYQNAAQAAAALPDNAAQGGNRPRPGDVIFQDNNSPFVGSTDGKQFADTADGRITPEDRTYLGKTIPDFFYGFNMNANFKGFDLAIFFQGVSGVQVYNQVRRGLEHLTSGATNQLTTTQNRWRGEGTSNTMPRAIDGGPSGSNNRFSSRWIEDAGFLRLKNVQLGYNLPQGLLTNTRAFKSARIYVAATNLFTITKYSGIDPEVFTFNQVSSQLSAGTDQGSTPQPRTFQAGIQFSF